MRSDLSHLESFRKVAGPYSSRAGDPFGAFYIRRGSVTLICIASPGDESMPWQHVSARARLINGNERVPSWAEMCWLKDQFWDDEDCVVQYHPPRAEYVNNHPLVLHLWKPNVLDLPRPPLYAV